MIIIVDNTGYVYNFHLKAINKAYSICTYLICAISSLPVCTITNWTICTIFFCCHCQLYQYSYDETKVNTIIFLHNTITAVCYRELREGIDIEDSEGNELGKSKVCYTMALSDDYWL